MKLMKCNFCGHLTNSLAEHNFFSFPLFYAGLYGIYLIGPMEEHVTSKLVLSLVGFHIQ